MTILRRTLLLLVASAALAWPAVAMAEAGPVHRALTGGVVDPGASALYIAPPSQGMVIVYRDGEAVGWFVNPGYLTVAPNGIYGIVATRGTSMLFNAQFRLRPGLTRVEWADGSSPTVLYQPAYPQARRPAQAEARPAARPPRKPAASQASGTPARPAARAQTPSQGAAVSSQRFAGLLQRLDAAGNEHDRYRALRAEAAGLRFSKSQERQILARFRSEAMRKKAAALVTPGAEAPRALPRVAVRR